MNKPSPERNREKGESGICFLCIPDEEICEIFWSELPAVRFSIVSAELNNQATSDLVAFK